jgi:ribosomal protein L37E
MPRGPAHGSGDLARTGGAPHDRVVTRDWRTEADDAWHAMHRGTFFKRRRSRMFTALADAELGPFRGAPRNPRLKLPDQGYSHMRHAQRMYAYTTIHVDLQQCRVCGYRLVECHRMMTWTQAGVVRLIGSVQKCRRCHRESWLFTSHMPATERARRIGAKVVL